MGTIAIVTIVILGQLAAIVLLFAQRGRARRTLAEAQRNEARYRTVVDAQSDLVCRFRPDSTLTFVNDAYCRLWRMSRDELVGMRFIELVPPHARQGVLERIGRLTRGEDTHEHPVMLPDGTTGWHHWINQAILDQDGRLIELQGVGRDVTERRRAEDALRQAEARNTAILHAIPDLMFICDRDGTYLDYHAPDNARLFAPPSEFIGRNMMEILPPGPAETLVRALGRASEGEPLVVEYTLSMPSPRNYEARLVAIDAGRVLTMVRDVTDTREAVARNRELAGRLIATQEQERTRIARELHDGVCQEMASITVDLGALRQDGEVTNPETQELLRSIELRAARGAETLRLLSHGLHPTVLNHVGLVGALRGHCAEIQRQHQLEVTFHADDEAEPTNQLVALSVYRVAQEALRNAARHARARRASVSLVRSRHDLSLQVTDDGEGFDPLVARQNGGLGLVSIEERVRLVSGTVAILSQPRAGTTIIVRVPLGIADRLQRSEAATRRAVTRRPATT